MKECTNPQYIVSQNSGDIHTEYFSVEPGSNPVIVNQIPAGKPTISGLGAEETIRALAKLLSDNGYCKMPEVVDAPESTIVQVTNSEVEEQTAIEEVPVDPSIPLVYTQKTENIDVGSGGIVAGVVAIPALIWGGQQLVSRIQNRMFTNDVNPIVINNYEDQIPENIYTPTKSTVAVSAAPVHEPSPWASTLAHTGTPYQTSDFGRNESTKSTRNDFEMTSEMENISDEMSQRISQVKTRLSNIFQNPESIGIQTRFGRNKL